MSSQQYPKLYTKRNGFHLVAAHSHYLIDKVVQDSWSMIKAPNVLTAADTVTEHFIKELSEHFKNPDFDIKKDSKLGAYMTIPCSRAMSHIENSSWPLASVIDKIVPLSVNQEHIMERKEVARLVAWLVKDIRVTLNDLKSPEDPCPVIAFHELGYFSMKGNDLVFHECLPTSAR